MRPYPDDNDRTTWRMYFLAVASIRCHPRNLQHNDVDELNRELCFAALAAGIMLDIEEEMWESSQDQSRPQSSAAE